jgi:hypothetical protein
MTLSAALQRYSEAPSGEYLLTSGTLSALEDQILNDYIDIQFGLCRVII